MNLFREKKVIEFNEKKVELYELNVKSLLKLANKEYKNNDEIIIDNSNLTKEDFEEMSPEAYNLILVEFFKLNSKHFSDGDERLDKKKS